MLLGLESPFDKSFLGSDLVQRHHLDADSNWNRCGAPLELMKKALGRSIPTWIETSKKEVVECANYGVRK